MKKITIIILTLILTSFLVKAQNEVDALRYSRITFGGTARYMAMSGAFGALGADFSSLSSNPAGIGLYKKSELSFTPSFNIGKTASDYNGTSSSDSKFNFNISNVGMIFTSKPGGKNSIVKNFQFAIGLNRLNNFNNRMMIEGVNDKNSIIDTYVDDANGIYYKDIEQDRDGLYGYDLSLAWWTYLIDTIAGTNNTYAGAITPGESKLQTKQLTSWGSMNEFVLALGANIGDRLYLGGTFGFPYIRYFQESLYSETDLNNNIYDFRKMRLYEDLRTHGSGFNMKFGMIVRATDWLRIGGAIHSPTWYNNMSDEWYSELSSEFDNNENLSSISPVGTYNYDLETPWRAIGSVSFIIKQFALISADYEYVDYSKARLRGRGYNSYDFYNENATIRNNYTAAHNIRIGGEYRYDHFAFRGGYAIYGSPFTSGINDGEINYFTGGIGYREKYFFVDLAYVRSVSNEDYYLYGSENVSVDPVKNKLISNNFLITIGFRY